MNSLKLNKGMYIRPKILPPSAWTGHIPFAAWLIQELKPGIIVELGAYHGASYLAFCQAVVEAGLGTSCYAVDTWKGDDHAGTYGEDVYEKLNEYHSRHYTKFSKLMRMTFDEAADYFQESTVDLLHIDGLHTYDGVKHDFEKWLPKMSDNGVVIFHDTMERERDFGVWKLWETISKQYPAFEFIHSHGLGVLAVGDGIPDSVRDLVATEKKEDVNSIRNIFSSLAELIEKTEQKESAEKEFLDLDEMAKALQLLKHQSDHEAHESRRQLKALEERFHSAQETISSQKNMMEIQRIQAEEIGRSSVSEARRLEAHVENLNAICFNLKKEAKEAADAWLIESEKHKEVISSLEMRISSLLFDTERLKEIERMHQSNEALLSDLKRSHAALEMKMSDLTACTNRKSWLFAKLMSIK